MALIALIRVATDVWCNNAGVGEAIPPQGYDFEPLAYGFEHFRNTPSNFGKIPIKHEILSRKKVSKYDFEPLDYGFETFSKHPQQFRKTPDQTRNLITKKGFENRFFSCMDGFECCMHMHGRFMDVHGCSSKPFFVKKMIRNSFHIISGFDEA